jgi:hypothetical protein
MLPAMSVRSSLSDAVHTSDCQHAWTRVQAQRPTPAALFGLQPTAPRPNSKACDALLLAPVLPLTAHSSFGATDSGFLGPGIEAYMTLSIR